MLRGLTSSSPYVTVANGNSVTYVNNYPTYENKTGYRNGDVQYDFNSQCMKVWNGQDWQLLSGSIASIDLSADAMSLLDWARKKRNEDWERERLAETNPTIKDLLEQIKLKEDQIKMVQTLLNSPGNDEIKPSMVP